MPGDVKSSPTVSSPLRVPQKAHKGSDPVPDNCAAQAPLLGRFLLPVPLGGMAMCRRAVTPAAFVLGAPFGGDGRRERRRVALR